MEFDPNSYRKRVLAAVEARGGPQASDPFELYDLDLDAAERISDAAVAERVAEVWAFWQRQRDHPKYSTLVAALVAGHGAASAQLLNVHARVALANRVRADRASRDASRYELLDGAVAALVARHGGIPRDKLAGLTELGRGAGLRADEVTARVRFHRVVDPAPAPVPAPPPPAGDPVPDHRRLQVRALLDELGRIWQSAPPVTLFALLGCDPDAEQGEITALASAWRSRARELPSDRVRTVVDELLVHVGDLLESRPAMRDAYLDSVAADVADKLRPRVRAAVLVEDRLTSADHAHLLDEAAALGLDPARSRRVLAGVAAELGAPVDAPYPSASSRGGADSRAAAGSRPGSGGGSPGGRIDTRRPDRPAGRAWEAPLRAARAALRAGRPVEAERLVEEARRAAMPERQPPISAAADEIAAVLAEARLRWRSAGAALDGRRYAEAVEHLEQLTRTAADLPGPDGSGPDGPLARARVAVDEADRLVAEALAGPEPARPARLLAALAACPGHPAALAALASVPLAAPDAVSAARLDDGSVTVSWAPSTSPEVTYRVSRLERDGTWRTVGRTSGTGVTDGGAGPGPRPPVYAVVALQAGRSSPQARSDDHPPTPVAADVPAPSQVRAVRAPDGTVDVTWAAAAAPAGLEFRVSRLAPDGSWRVVGRTAGRHLSDGGAPPGPLPVYAVTARHGGAASEPSLSAAPSSPTPMSSDDSSGPAAPDVDPEPGGMPDARDLALDAVSGRLVFSWPAGVTEVLVVLRTGAPPLTPDDPAATAWKVTNTRYEIDGGVPLPARTTEGPRYVAVASCRRADGKLVVAPGFAPSARLDLADR